VRSTPSIPTDAHGARLHAARLQVSEQLAMSGSTGASPDLSSTTGPCDRPSRARPIFRGAVRKSNAVRSEFTARPMLATSLAVIETACADTDDTARRHAAAARAWLEGDPALALGR
jgi:hypothetical protein